MNRRSFIAGSAFAMTTNLKSHDYFSSKNLIKHFIYIDLKGGPSQFELWDPKPTHINGGPTKAIKTKVPNLLFAAPLEGLAEISNNMVIIRASSMTNDHKTGRFHISTGGLYPTTNLNHLSMSAFIGHHLHKKSSILPSTVHLKRQVINTPSIKAPYNLHNSSLFPAQINKLNQNRFNLDNMSQVDVEAYGNDFGQNCLKARQLIAAGVPSIHITFDAWDTHQDNFTACTKLTKSLNQGLSQLVKDLKEFGMFDQTMIMIAGEFGRTPRININEGRDHFSENTPVALISGKLRGEVFGQSNFDGTKLKNAVPISAVSNSIYKLIGITL